MKPRLALRMKIRPFMKSRLAIRLMKYESTLLNQYPHKHLPNQSPPHPHNFRPTLAHSVSKNSCNFVFLL